MSVENLQFNYVHIQSLFNIEDSRDSFIYSSDKGEDLPQALKKASGHRYWTYSMLPLIAKKYSSLPSPVNKLAPVISFYLTKGGGSHKTTDAFSMATYLAIHGKKVLVIDLDYQLSLTTLLGIKNTLADIEQTKLYYEGLYEVLQKGKPIEETIFPTTFENISLLPASHNLVGVEALLYSKVRREEIFKNLIAPLRKQFDAIIIDNNPSWSQLSISSLFACSLNVASLGIDSNTNSALPQFFGTLKMAGIPTDNIYLAQGLHENNTLKTEIKDHLKANYADLLSEVAIRKSTFVDEANALSLPVFLYKPKEKVSEEYLRLCAEIWRKACLINK